MTARQTTAVIFGDLAGSTRLYEQLGDEAAARIVADCVRVMREAVGQNAGSVVRTREHEASDGEFRGGVASRRRLTNGNQN